MELLIIVIIGHLEHMVLILVSSEPKLCLHQEELRGVRLSLGHQPEAKFVILTKCCIPGVCSSLFLHAIFLLFLPTSSLSIPGICYLLVDHPQS